MDEKISARLGETLARRRLELEQSYHPNAGRGNVAMRLYKLGIKPLLFQLYRLRFVRRLGLGQALRPRLEQLDLELPNLPAAFEGVRLLHLSDTHLDFLPDLLEPLKRLIDESRHDYVLHTGDFRERGIPDHARALELTGELARSFQGPAYGVLGNHDRLAMVDALETMGIRILLNEACKLERNGSVLWLAGVDDAYFFETHDLEQASASIPENACRILLSHDPVLAPDAAKSGYDLMLSGHTHGGQVCLPGGFPLVMNSRAPRRLLSGAWREGRLQGYTSRGAGSCGLPTRAFCPPELTIMTLHKA